MTTPTRNRELFYKIAEQIEKHPETYDQSTWGGVRACGTAHCVAGHVAVQCGYYPTKAGPHSETDWWGMVSKKPGLHYCGDEVDPSVEDVQDVAAKLLGLDPVEASILFGPNWRDDNYKDVPTALRAYGDGATIEHFDVNAELDDY